MEYQVIENINISLSYHKLSLEIPPTAKLPLPGQFYTVRCGETKDPLLRRPFSMHRLIKRGEAVHLEILYRVVGKGTEWLSTCKVGHDNERSFFMEAIDTKIFFVECHNIVD